MTTKDTRALTRLAFPHIMAEGLNPSVNNVKEWVRESQNLPEWNPSTTTVQDELTRIRKEAGASLLAGVKFPGVDLALAEATGEYFQMIINTVRQAVIVELDGRRQEIENLLIIERDKTATAERDRAELQQVISRMEEAAREVEYRNQATVETLQSKVDAVLAELEAKGLALAEAVTRGNELQIQVTRISTEREADAQRHDDQLKLAEERYRELEKAKLIELDSARTQSARLVSENERIREELTESRIMASSKSIQAAEAEGELRGIRKDRDDLKARYDLALSELGGLKEKLLAGDAEIASLKANAAKLLADNEALMAQASSIDGTEKDAARSPE